jgi:hypothetical protein
MAALPIQTLVALIGATIIFCRGVIFARVRGLWPIFFTCPLCVGFWVGGLFSIYVHRALSFDFLLYGCLVAILSLATDAWLAKQLGD